MKTSNKILFITGVVIVVIVFVLVAGSRIMLNKYSDNYKSSDSNYEDIKTEYTEITGFTSLDITGEWDVTVNQGDSYSVTIISTKASEDLYEIINNGNTLILKENHNINIDKDLTLEITMPEITEIISTGGIKLFLTGFIEPELILHFSGGTWAQGNNCKFGKLFLTSVGAINLEFEEIKTENTDVQLSGVGNLLLNMTGGTLSGNASGAINLEYYGDAIQKINAEGFTIISTRD